MKRVVLLCLLGVSLISRVCTQNGDMALLLASRPNVLRIDHVTQNPEFIQWINGLELAGVTINEKANTFFADYAPAFGVKEPTNAFLLEHKLVDKAGNFHLKFQQFFEGIPFFGAQLNLHFNSRGELKTINGVIFADPTSSSFPLLNYFEAISSAMSFMNKTFPGEDLNSLSVQQSELQLYHHGLAMQRTASMSLAYALLISNQKNIREYIFIDAQNGQTIAHFPANCSLVHRRLFFENRNTELWAEGDILPGLLDSWQQNQLRATAETYAFFSNTFQYHSFDNLDAEMQLIDQVSFLDCPNASWNGVSANFCEELSSDDVVAHEWGHAYTEHTSQLLYAWQAGAINEAYSDIWGETIDLLNGDENQDEHRTECSDNVRWKIGEDAIGIAGPIRDMWRPGCYDDPGKISDTTYHCQESDYGGVHTNSGIVNHAYALLVDGGEYNGYNIEGIGITKAAHVFWHTQRYYLTRTSDFAALADGLEAACHDLYTIDLDQLSIAHPGENLSGEYFSSFDSLQLHNVLLAVEMRATIEQCEEYVATLSMPAPAICSQEGVAFDPFFIETFEQGAEEWGVSHIAGDTDNWVERNWVVSGNLPDERLGKAMYAATPNVGNCSTNMNHGLLRLESPVISIPDDIENDVLLTFNHYFSFEKNQDGGNLKIQRNGNNWMNITPSAFLHNGYNQFLNSNSNTNPLNNQKVFTGANQGSVAGSWGTTQIKLSVLGVKAGDDLIIRWEVGTDGCDGWDGWYIDDVLLATCSAAAALPVSYLRFDAKPVNDDVFLDWQTATEFNNKGFHIERSFDGRHFNTIGWIAAYESQRYQFTDLDPASHQSIYYRLRQEDFDGNTTLSVMKTVRLDPNSEWLAFPNPASSFVYIQPDKQKKYPFTIALYSLDGRLLLDLTTRFNNQSFEFSLKGITPGVYLLKMQSENDLSYKRLIVN